MNKKIQEGLNNGTIIDFKNILVEIHNDPKKRKAYEKVYNDELRENEVLIRSRLARKIKNARLKSGKTQEDLAKKLHTTRSYISEIESGRQNVSIEYFVKIAHALNKRVKIDIY